MSIYKDNIEKDLDIEELSDAELTMLLNEAGRDLVYNYLLFKKDITYEMFIENMKIVLKLRENESMELKEF